MNLREAIVAYRNPYHDAQGRFASSKTAKKFIVPKGSKRHAGKTNGPINQPPKLKAQKVNSIDEIAPYLKAVKSANGEGSERLRANAGIHHDLRVAAQDPTQIKSIRAIKDEAGNIQALAKVTKRRDLGALEIDLLATSPWNADPKSNDPRKVKGAGTSAILAAIEESRESGYKGRLYLMAINNARPFYEKLGFEPISAGSKYMELSEQKAKELMTRAGMNFNESDDEAFWDEVYQLEAQAEGAFVANDN